MQTVITINAVIMALFFVCYSYQFFYVAVALLKRKKFTCRNENHRIAVLIAARNEENVIGQLLDSIHVQKKYPMDHVDIYVGADNCTDDTARVARERGAIVFERHDTVHVGKGYVLNEMLKRIKRTGRKHYDAYLVLDADNILDPNFISEIEKVYSSGYEIVTCYRNSKNYGDNWISAGYALWFLRESRYLNSARARLGSSCGVSGTGFLFSQAVLDAQGGGWPFHLLTEDIEFTIDNVTRGMKVGYCPDAIAYDEQPISFRQSWAQRLRWSRGYLQVFKKYGRALISGIFSGSFSCYDMAMSIMPAAVLTGLSIVVNLGAALVNVLYYHEWGVLGVSALQTLVNLYLTLFIIGAITTATEWKSIHCEPAKKIFYVFTFPLFMLSYVPIVIHSLFVTPEWTHIDHTRTLDVQQICAGQYRDAV